MSKGFGKKGRTAPFNTSPSRFSHSGTPMRPPGSSTTVRLPAPRPQSYQTFVKERYAGAMPKSQPLKKKEAVPEATIKDDVVANAKTRRVISMMQSKVKKKIAKMLEKENGTSPPAKETPPIAKFVKKGKSKGKGKGKGKSPKGHVNAQEEVKHGTIASNPFDVGMEVEQTVSPPAVVDAKSGKVDVQDPLDKPLSQLIAEARPPPVKQADAKDFKNTPPPYSPPKASGKDSNKYAPGELTLGQFHALDDLQEMMQAHVENDAERRVTQADLMTYSQRLMSIANMAGRTC